MIVPGASMARLRQRFRDQFTPAATGYVYRRGSRGEAIPVSAADTAAFIAGFERASRRMSWGGVLGAVAVFAAIEASGWHPPAWAGPDGFWAGAVPFVAIWLALFWVIWNAPHRILNGRAPVAPPLTGAQVRRQGMRTLPWNVLVLGALAAIALGVQVALRPDRLAPANLSYLVFAIVLLLFFAGMAVAKIRAR